MKRLLISFCFFATLSILTSCSSKEEEHNPWGDELARYTIEQFMPAEKYIWNWNQAVFLKALVERCENNIQKEKMLPYIRTAMDATYAEANGLHPNAVVSGLGMAYLAQEGYGDQYKTKALEVYEQSKNIPRTDNGGISHRDNSFQLWDDTVYMMDEFFMQMYKLTGDEKFLKEAIHQLYAHAEKLEDPAVGLWYHGWDNDPVSVIDPCCLLGWSDNPERRNNEFWGRGNGWITMTLVNLLELLPENQEDYGILKSMYIKMINTLMLLQDLTTGHWYQLPIYSGEEGNFIESSCTAMFAYSITIGVKNGWLSKEKFMPIIENAYHGLEKYSLKPEGDYFVMLNICEGTCIGDKNYYFNRDVVDKREFGFGVAIMFYDQYHLLKSN